MTTDPAPGTSVPAPKRPHREPIRPIPPEYIEIGRRHLAAIREQLRTGKVPTE